MHPLNVTADAFGIALRNGTRPEPLSNIAEKNIIPRMIKIFDNKRFLDLIFIKKLV